MLALALGLAACGDDELTESQVALVAALDTPAAAGSFAPHISSGTDGTTVLSWLEPQGKDQHALNFSILGADGWGPATMVTAGANWFANWADFPSVVPISESLWGAHWLVRRDAGGYAYDINAVLSNDAGQTWSAPFNPHSDDTDTEHGFVSMYPADDGIGMIWLDGRKFVNEVTDDVAASGMTLRSAVFGTDLAAKQETMLDELICDCCQTDVAVTGAGPVAIYRNRTENEIRDIYVARQIDGQWLPGTAVSDDNWEIPGCPVNGPVIQSDGMRVAAAWFSAPGDKPRVQAAWSNDAGESFSTPVLVSDDAPLGHVGAAMLANGDLVVSWQRRTRNGGAELCLRRVSASGSHGDVRVVGEAADLFAMSVPQLASAGDDLLLAWTVEVDGAYAIRSARVPVAYFD